MSDTIAAVSTGTQVCAIGIVRMSGGKAIEIADRLFSPVSGRKMADCEDRKLIYGKLCDEQGRLLDICLCTISRAPNSYTGEDTAEFQCHGSPVVLRAVLEAAFSLGARQALPGEFTKRAFLNGRMDLSGAEAVADIIDAETAEAARNAAGQLGGAISRKIDAVYDTLTDISSHYHAVLDYPDEDIEDFTLARYESDIERCTAVLEGLRASYDSGKLLHSGVPAAIVGRPNAGKSSLLNAVLGYDRAIVTDIPGTTRDTVEEKAVVGGVLLRLIDTAGIRETDDAVERLGVERSRRAVESADLVIVVADGSHTPLTVEPDILALAARAPHWILAISKDDRNPAVKTAVWRLPDGAPAPEHLVSFNSVMPGGLDALIDTIGDCFPAGVPAGGTLLTNARQAEAIRRALESVRAAREALTAGLTPDVVLTEAEGALDALGELTGRTAREDMVTRIFERFCVGK